jgi:hypothetical protein
MDLFSLPYFPNQRSRRESPLDDSLILTRVGEAGEFAYVSRSQTSWLGLPGSRERGAGEKLKARTYAKTRFLNEITSFQVVTFNEKTGFLGHGA